MKRITTEKIVSDVCIVGVGARTSIGLTAAATAAAARAGISGYQEHSFMINREGEPYVLATIPTIDPDLMGSDRYLAIAIPVLQEALSPLRQLKENGIEILAFIGLPEQRPGVPVELPQFLGAGIKQLSNDRFAIEEVSFASNGHAAGLMAFESASNSISAGKSEFCLVGGIDSYIDPDTLDWVEDNEQLHTPDNAWGFVPGEASAYCLLCSGITAKRYGLPIKARLVSIATAHEKNRIKTETVCIGDGLTEAARKVIGVLPEGIKIDQTYCDQNGEAYRADEFGFMLARLSEHFVDPSEYVALADCWGDVGAASGPLFINQLCAAAEKKYELGPYSLLWASSEGGERTAAILETNTMNPGIY